MYVSQSELIVGHKLGDDYVKALIVNVDVSSWVSLLEFIFVVFTVVMFVQLVQFKAPVLPWTDKKTIWVY